MTGHAAIPDGVDEKSAALLRRAYDLTSVEQGQELYVEWAQTYDATMIDGLGYLSPKLLAALLASHVADRSALVLDLGVGTGLVGAELATHGFTRIDGLDLSAAMMAQAAARGLYGRFIEADMTGVLPIADGTYGAAICNGTFTSGHVGAECLDEIVRVLAPGGVFAAAVHNSVWHDLGFDEGFARLQATGALEEVEIVPTGFYKTSEGIDGRLCAFRVPSA